MKIYGTSVLKGLMYTLKTFIGTYREDLRRMSGKVSAEHGLRTANDQDGICTVQYPENPMPVGETYERFRVLPMLIYDQKEDEQDVRCTACGICAKVCPPQCIWIVQETNEKGKPVPNPEDFHIDMSVCMNCGLCTEFCPFDAIKMDHKIELTLTDERYQGYLYNKEKLLVSADYYAGIHPKANAAEVKIREEEAEAKRKKEEAKAKKAAEKAAAAKAKKEAPSTPSTGSGDGEDAKAKKKAAKADDPERAARIAAAKEKAAAAKAKKEADASTSSVSGSVATEKSASAEEKAEQQVPESTAGDSSTAPSSPPSGGSVEGLPSEETKAEETKADSEEKAEQQVPELVEGAPSEEEAKAETKAPDKKALAEKAMKAVEAQVADASTSSATEEDESTKAEADPEPVEGAPPEETTPDSEVVPESETKPEKDEA